MRKMAVLLVFLSAFAYGQINLFAADLATPEDFGNMTDVIETKLKKDIVYDRSLKWVATKYNSPKTVMQMSDKPAGIITFNGGYVHNQSIYSFLLEYKVMITIKDNKLKFQMTPICWTYARAHQTEEKYYKEMAVALSKEYARLRDSYKEYIMTNDDF